MTHDTKHAPRRAATRPGPRIQSGAGSRAGMPAAALIGALALAGCSSGNIGESWQCPLAKGGSCDSVAAADPAVPDPAATRATVLAEPLWRVRGDERATLADETPCASACGPGFDPFAWLARLFGGGDPGSPAGAGGDGTGDRGAAMAAAARPASETPSAPGAAVRETEASPPAPEKPASGIEDRATAEPATAALQAAPDPAKEEPAADGLRTGETVARIWIAPFVDADGVYREASHVRVVLEPAGWRLR